MVSSKPGTHILRLRLGGPDGGAKIRLVEPAPLMLGPDYRKLELRRNEVLSVAPIILFQDKLRAPEWRDVRVRHLELFDRCAACGTRRELTVHHVKPYHLHPELELDPDNLITLCEYHHCHLLIGHLCSWYSYNVRVRADAKRWLRRVQNRP